MASTQLRRDFDAASTQLRRGLDAIKGPRWASMGLQRILRIIGTLFKPIEARGGQASMEPPRGLHAFCVLFVHFSNPSRPVEALADLALYNTKRESESLDGLKTCQASLLLEF